MMFDKIIALSLMVMGVILVIGLLGYDCKWAEKYLDISQKIVGVMAIIMIIAMAINILMM